MDLSTEIYGSWKEKQIEKYRDMLKVPGVQRALEESETALDIGIGKAWLWSYLKEEGYRFRKITGVDVSRKATEPEKKDIEYIYSKSPEIDKEFDLVVFLDSIHLIDYADRIPNYVSSKGYLLQSVPLKFKESLERYKDMETIREGEVGIQEKDHYLLQTKE